MTMFSSIILTVAILATSANVWMKWSVLMGPDVVVPLLLQCFKDNGFTCSKFETVDAA
jgi:hypothetical protein